VSLDYRAARQTVAIAWMATFEPSEGWSLIVATTALTDGHPVSDRLRYRGLTSAELTDVIEATASSALG
jgi:acyl-CoA synthetase (NDP forming)